MKESNKLERRLVALKAKKAIIIEQIAKIRREIEGIRLNEDVAERIRPEISMLAKEVMILRESGETYKAIGDHFGHTATWAADIYHRAMCKNRIRTFIAPDISPDTNIQNLEMSIRLSNALQNRHIFTLREASMLSREDWFKTRNFGRYSMVELVIFLQRAGLNLKS